MYLFFIKYKVCLSLYKYLNTWLPIYYTLEYFFNNLLIKIFWVIEYYYLLVYILYNIIPVIFYIGIFVYKIYISIKNKLPISLEATVGITFTKRWNIINSPKITNIYKRAFLNNFFTRPFLHKRPKIIRWSCSNIGSKSC